MFCMLADRFNPNFNVETETSQNLSLFLRNKSAVDYINHQKQILIDACDELNDSQHRDYIKALSLAVSTLPDVNEEDLESAFHWEHIVRDKIDGALRKLDIEKEEKLKEISKLHQTKKETKPFDKTQYYTLQYEIEHLQSLAALTDTIAFGEHYKQLITSKLLLIVGHAGMGKSQLLASEVKSALCNQVPALLFLAGEYYLDTPICEQVMKYSELSFSFDDLLDILETIGEEKRCFVAVCIDALNETWNYSLWKPALLSIAQKLNDYKWIKIAVSYRTEYESAITPDVLLPGSKNAELNDGWNPYITYRIVHTGFANNEAEASKRFFDYYKIPFTLYEYFEVEMTNPLFLTLYCKTYNGDEVSLPELYNRLILNANKSVYHSLAKGLRENGFTEDENFVQEFVDEVIKCFTDKEEKSIKKSDLMQLPFWAAYNISMPAFMALLRKEHLIYANLVNGQERYYFEYDQMNDYFYAKSIFSNIKSKEAIRDYLKDKILMIKNGSIIRYENCAVFAICCAFYARMFNGECIDLIDGVENEIEKNGVINYYIQSFVWRDKAAISASAFYDNAMKYKVPIEDFWSTLIANSVKCDHPLNADFLHEILIKYPLNARDYYWTQYINGLFDMTSNRVVQLVKMYNKGECIQMSKEQARLLMILWCWMLSSSDRRLRDYTSKAMVEVLKNNFELCEVMLKKFQDVNDPYILQRLYGVVFGAYCKCTELQENVIVSLMKYVYDTIFGKELVYPDILLRDYARMILEKFLYSYPNYSSTFPHEKITPPYKSQPIVPVNDDYVEMECSGGLWHIQSSMRFEGLGMYGDFGRYVFQSALRYFDVGLSYKEIYNYAMSFIVRQLGYKNKLDNYVYNPDYSRHDTMKRERIGKKYQWIAMYNILARISDACKFHEAYYDEPTIPKFEGAWNLFVRNFDPTLNCHFMKCDNLPQFCQIMDFKKKVYAENSKVGSPGAQSEDEWLTTSGLFIDDLPNMFILTDGNGIEWVRLTHIILGGNHKEHYYNERLQVWSWNYAYFVNRCQIKHLEDASNGKMDFSKFSQIGYNPEMYNVFNREYPWSPSCQKVNNDIVKILSLIVKKDDNHSSIEDIKLMHTGVDIIWESEFDASKPETISWSVPCPELIAFFHLKQMKFDGIYYDGKEQLAVYDLGLSQNEDGIVIRKDLLDEFLERFSYSLIWFVHASKEIHGGPDSMIQKQAERSGIVIYDGKKLTSNIYQVKERY